MGNTNIYSAFLQDLSAGIIQPGERLSEERLAARWNVSRLPVRDALIRLEAEGLLERLPRSGTYVRQASPEEVNEIFKLRAAIEAVVIREVAQLATDKELDELQKLARSVDNTANYKDVEEIIQREMEFHLKLCEIAKMRHATRMLSMSHLLARAFHVALQQAGNRPSKQHQDMVRVLRTRNADRCEAFVRQDIEQARETILALMRKQAETQ